MTRRLRLLLFWLYHASMADLHRWHRAGDRRLAVVHGRLADEAEAAWDSLRGDR